MSKQLFLNTKGFAQSRSVSNDCETAFATMSWLHEDLLGCEEERKVQIDLLCGHTHFILVTGPFGNHVPLTWH